MGLKNLYQDWRTKKKAEWEARILDKIGRSEEIESWIVAFTAPHEILDWAPGLDFYYRLKTTNYLLALTSTSLHILPVKKGSLSEFAASGDIRLDRSRIGAEFKETFMTSLLKISETGGRSHTFKLYLAEDGPEFVERLNAAPELLSRAG